MLQYTSISGIFKLRGKEFYTLTRHFSMPDLTDYTRANDIGDIDETKLPAIAKDDRRGRYLRKCKATVSL